MNLLRLPTIVFCGALVAACSAAAAPVVTDTDDASLADRVDAGADSDVDAPVAAECPSTVSSAVVSDALVSTDPSTGKHVWIVRARSDETFFTVTVRESAGAAPGPSAGAFGDEQLRPTTAAVSLLVQTECHLHGDHYHCGPSFVPTAGEWAFTALGAAAGERFAVSFSADLVQAKITGGVARPTAGGAAVCVRGVSLSGTLATP